MTGRRVELALWVLALGAAACGAVAWTRDASVPVSPARRLSLTAPVAPTVVETDSLESAAEETAANDPFRLARAPSSVPFEPTSRSTVAGPPPLPTSRPALKLAGVIGGPPWEALLEGIPGREGSALVRRGDVLGTLTVRSVGRDTVVVQGIDTTWRLTMKRTWR